MTKTRFSDRNLQIEVKKAYDSMPFKTQLSFEPLLRSLNDMISNNAGLFQKQGEAFIKAIEEICDLHGVIRSEDVLSQHRDVVDMLMSFIFPDLEDDVSLGCAHAPFSMEIFFRTTQYEKVFEAEGVEVGFSESMIIEDLFRANLIFAYGLIYGKHYGSRKPRKTIIKRIHDTRTRLDRYFMLEYYLNFVDVDLGGLELIPEKDFFRLLVKEDLDDLIRQMPLDSVVFSGFNYLKFLEITEKENISLLKSSLIGGKSLTNTDKNKSIQQRFRSIFQLEDMQAGVILRYNGLQAPYCNQRSLLKDYPGDMVEIGNTVYGEVLRSGKPLFSPILSECNCDSGIIQHLLSNGIKSLGLIPLVEDDGTTIGILELASGIPGEISSFAAHKMAELLPVLTIAVRREMDALESRIDWIIKTNCTAIHPSVEWRFVDAAMDYNRKLENGETAKFEDIVFRDVYPLYGSMDIRNSSTKRNQAIQADMLEHIVLARKTLSHIHNTLDMPIAGYYDSVLNNFAESVSKTLQSGDEVSIIEFLHSKVEPFFNYVRDTLTITDDNGDPIADYYSEMDPSIGILYQKRKDYEDSVTLINETLSRFIDQEELKAQEIFPHYFEKYRTDGVEYNIYVGQSMAHEHKFDSVQFENLRIWQLQLMCGMARVVESLTDRMPVPLWTSPLVLAHSQPLTIAFKTDEKQFEAEGTYNIRYEIIKKRIDKALVVGTGERLTQPGKLAVIYTQDRERDEYIHYFEYMIGKGLLKPGVEELVLEDLQGVHGLRAIRADIILD